MKEKKGDSNLSTNLQSHIITFVMLANTTYSTMLSANLIQFIHSVNNHNNNKKSLTQQYESHYNTLPNPDLIHRNFHNKNTFFYS